MLTSFYDLYGNEIFSQLDLNMGCHQLEIRECDREKTAMPIDGHKYEFQRMPFGLSNSPFTFPRVMMEVFGDLCFVIF